MRDFSAAQDEDDGAGRLARCNGGARGDVNLGELDGVEAGVGGRDNGERNRKNGGGCGIGPRRGRGRGSGSRDGGGRGDGGSGGLGDGVAARRSTTRRERDR